MLVAFLFGSVFYCSIAQSNPLSEEQSQAIQKLRTEPTLRVLVKEAKSFSVSGRDLLFNEATSLEGEHEIKFQCRNNVIYQNGKKLRAEHTDITSKTGFLFVQGKPYRQHLRVTVKGSLCRAINYVSLEKYLASSINSEMGESTSMEALKAQAVAARSYALYKVGINQNRSFDVVNTVADQVYQGSARETFRSHQAVNTTRGWVLENEKQVLKAYYHANCGGVTTTPKIVWGEENQGKYKQVTCPLHQKKKSSWRHRISKFQLQAALQKVLGGPAIGSRAIASLRPGISDSHKRLQTLVLDDQGKEKHILANKLRLEIGANAVKSTRFSVTKDKAGYTLIGNGFGHGVGMCQKGAKYMAKQGSSYLKILRHYYPQARLRRLYY